MVICDLMLAYLPRHTCRVIQVNHSKWRRNRQGTNKTTVVWCFWSKVELALQFAYRHMSYLTWQGKATPKLRFPSTIHMQLQCTLDPQPATSPSSAFQPGAIHLLLIDCLLISRCRLVDSCLLRGPRTAGSRRLWRLVVGRFWNGSRRASTVIVGFGRGAYERYV